MYSTAPQPFLVPLTCHSSYHASPSHGSLLTTRDLLVQLPVRQLVDLVVVLVAQTGAVGRLVDACTIVNMNNHPFAGSGIERTLVGEVIRLLLDARDLTTGLLASGTDAVAGRLVAFAKSVFGFVEEARHVFDCSVSSEDGS
jgi:hypothetical protein